jgi:hypothetical protein
MTTMRKTLLITGALVLLAAGGRAASAKRSAAAPTATGPVAPPHPGKKLFLDVHVVGKGKVTAKDVAAAHQKDLATQGKYGVDYRAYWFNEKEGKIYCLVEAPSAESAAAVHKEAHGLVADSIEEVTEGR